MMSSPRSQPESNRARALLAVLILSCLVFMVTYAGRLVEKWRVESQALHWRQHVEDAEQSNAVLRKELEYVQGQDYVDEAARNELGLSKEGDQIVAIVDATPAVPSAPVVQAGDVGIAEGLVAPQQQRPSWQQWWEVFAEPASRTP